ncbi:MAG: hypothetical protein IPO92_20515 [Saprospiraceae bacterium]|nr:hypothetical protein [Saprospiraceae bacterium]
MIIHSVHRNKHHRQILFSVNRQYIINHKAVGKNADTHKIQVKINLLPTNEEVITSTERSPLFKKWLVG